MANFPHLGAWFHTLAKAGAGFLYPPACPLCCRGVSEDLGAITGGFCLPCWEALVHSRGAACLRCGATIGPNLDPAAGCSYCIQEHFAFDRVFCIGIYEDALRAACLRAKQNGAEPLAACLATSLWRKHEESLRQTPIDIVVGIPQHWLLRWVRPHHTADTLAAVLARRLQLPLGGHILKKVRWTRFQVHLGLTERRVNLKRAFAVTRPREIAGATVLLVDDILTTGTTANEAAKVLKKAGAARVVVAVLARGLGRRASFDR